MQHPPISFTKILFILGILLLGAVVLDLSFRGMHRFPAPPLWDIPEGDVERGRRAIVKHGCGACHVIPGVRGANGRVGPKLEGFRDQIYIAGKLPNVPGNLIVWILDPQGINPGSAMPDLQLTPEEATDIAAYFYANP